MKINLNKKGMKLETPFLAILFASLFFLGFFTIFMGLAQTYDVSYDVTVVETQNGTSINDALDRINETRTEMNELNQEFSSTEMTETTSLYSFFSLAWEIGKHIYGSLNILKDLMVIITEILVIPPIIYVTLFAALSTVFVLLVIFILIGRST